MHQTEWVKQLQNGLSKPQNGLSNLKMGKANLKIDVIILCTVEVVHRWMSTPGRESTGTKINLLMTSSCIMFSADLILTGNELQRPQCVWMFFSSYLCLPPSVRIQHLPDNGYMAVGEVIKLDSLFNVMVVFISIIKLCRDTSILFSTLIF